MYETLTVARKEFRDSLRNRWILAITVVLTLFALGLAYFGAATAGQVGFVSLDTTIISLASLAIYIIPLIALLLAYHSVVGEEEQGTLLLLLSYPLTHLQLLGGKFLGHAAALAISTIAGFGLAGIVIATLSSDFSALDLWSSLGWFILTSVLLGWVFIAIAYLISTLVSEKSRAAGLALIVWFLFVLVFDLGLLGLLVASDGAVSSELFPYLLLLNPTDVFRLANLAGFEATQAYSGLVSIASARLFQPGLLVGILLLWVIVPFSLAAWLFHKRIS